MKADSETQRGQSPRRGRGPRTLLPSLAAGTPWGIHATCGVHIPRCADICAPQGSNPARDRIGWTCGKLKDGTDGRPFVGIKDLSADKREKRPKMTVQGQQSITTTQRTRHSRVFKLICTETFSAIVTGLRGRRCCQMEAWAHPSKSKA